MSTTSSAYFGENHAIKTSALGLNSLRFDSKGNLVWPEDKDFWSRYKVEKLISNQYYGDVYIISLKSDAEQRFVVKIIEELKETTKNEVLLLSAILSKEGECNPSIVCLKEYAIVPSPKDSLHPVYAIVMNYVPGEDLFDFQAKYEGLKGNRIVFSQADPKLVKKLFISALESLKILHDQGIAHRDIKPDNLRVVGEKVVILDLGLACFKEEKGEDREGKEVRAKALCSKDKQILGTPCYSMSPDRFRDESKQTDETMFKSDVYAIATSFYPLIVGRLPPACEEEDKGKDIKDFMTRRPKFDVRQFLISQITPRIGGDRAFAEVFYEMLGPTDEGEYRRETDGTITWLEPPRPTVDEVLKRLTV